MTTYTNPADDDAYRSLFRQEDLEPVGFPEEFEPVGFPDASIAEDRQPSDTGRLFRSGRVTSDSDAIIALRSDQAAQLRTVSESSKDMPMPVSGRTGNAERVLVNGDAQENVHQEKPARKQRGRAAKKRAREESESHSWSSSSNSRTSASDRPESDPNNRGLRSLGVYLVVIGVTLLAGLADYFVAGPGLGWPTGVALVAASTICALRVRPSDATVAVLAPAISFFLACITVGQIGATSTGGVILGRGVTVFFTLAENWMWIVGATLISLLIVIVRSRRRQ